MIPEDSTKNMHLLIEPDRSLSDIGYRNRLLKSMKYLIGGVKPVCPIETTYVSETDEKGRPTRTERHPAMLLVDGSCVIKIDEILPCGCHYLELKRLDTEGRRIDSSILDYCTCNEL